MNLAKNFLMALLIFLVRICAIVSLFDFFHAFLFSAARLIIYFLSTLSTFVYNYIFVFPGLLEKLSLIVADDRLELPFISIHGLGK